MKIRFGMLICFSFIFTLVSCATGNINPRLSEFSSSVKYSEEVVIDVFEEMQSLEIEVRSQEAALKGSVSPDDFLPGTFSFKVIGRRAELMSFLSEYTKALDVIFKGNREDILENMKNVMNSIENISRRHPALFSDKSKGMVFLLSTAIPRALSFGVRRRLVLRTMKSMGKMLKKISEKLKEEMDLSFLLAENFFNRLFRERIAKRWPDKIEKREKYINAAKKLVLKKYRLSKNINNLKKALDLLPETHDAILDAMVKKKAMVSGVRDFVDYIYKLKRSYHRLRGEG